jgi:hypothetical protein
VSFTQVLLSVGCEPGAQTEVYLGAGPREILHAGLWYFAALPPRIRNTRIWSAVRFAAVRVSARAAATQSPLCPAFHALIWQQERERERGVEGERR